MKKEENRKKGNTGEELTAYFLVKNGYRILERNYTVSGGEIDIIAEKNGVIAFVEVKTRSQNAFESGVFAVTKKKQRLIIKTSQTYLFRIGSSCQPRFDVADVVISNGKPVRFKYYDNAFNASDCDVIL